MTEFGATKMSQTAFLQRRLMYRGTSASASPQLLKAYLLCPIHYGQFANVDSYREHPEVVEIPTAAAAREGVRLLVAEDGEVELQ